MVTTTIQISPAIRQAIRDRGMTVKGAFLEGWKAIEERQRWAAQLAEQNRYLDRAKQTIAELRQRVTKLEEQDGN